jgi:hypothetical protein
MRCAFESQGVFFAFASDGTVAAARIFVGGACV